MKSKEALKIINFSIVDFEKYMKQKPTIYYIEEKTRAYNCIQNNLEILEIIKPYIDNYFWMYSDVHHKKIYIDYETYKEYCRYNNEKQFWNEEQFNKIKRWLINNE